MGRWLAIVNTHAGAFRNAGFRERWMLRASDVADTIVYTEGPGHATEIVRAAHDYDGIAVVGGDGTLFEVLGGLPREGPTLAIVPAGRGNCLALDLDVGTVPRALEAIAEGVVVDVDLMSIEMQFVDGRRESCRAASTIAVGYVADTVVCAAGLRPFGRYAYAVAAACTVPRRRTVELSYDGSASCVRSLTGLIVNNTSHLANFRAFPRASPCDGAVDVLENGIGWSRQMLHNVAVLTRSYFYHPGGEKQAREVSVALPEATRLMVDGEIFERVVALDVRCEPAAARFVRGRT